MESLRSKTFWAKKKWHKLKRNSFKTETLSRPPVSSSSVSFSSSSSSSFPDYRQTEVFANTEMVVDGGPITLFPSHDHGDHHQHHRVAIPEAATSSNAVVDEQMIISSSVVPSEQTAFQKFELTKVGLNWVVPAIMLLMSTYISAFKTYSSTIEAESKFIYSGPAPAPDHESKFPQWVLVSVACTLMCGTTLSIIGILLSEMFALFARFLEVVGFLLIALGVIGLGSSMLPKVLMWFPWLCYTMLFIAILLDQFRPKLAALIRRTLLARSGN